MKRIYLMIALLMALLIVSVAPAFAQESFTFCGDLAEADCTLLKDSAAAEMQIHSGTAQFDMTFSLANIPNAPFDSLDIAMNGNGAFTIDPALMDQMHALQNDPSAMFSDPEASAKLMVDLIKGISGDMTLNVTLPPKLTDLMASEDTTFPSSFSIGLRMVDGFAYINLDDIAAAMPDAGVPAGWTGIDLATFMEQAIQQGGMSATSGMAQSYMHSFMDPAFLREFMTVERQADTEVMGQQAAVFLYTFDYGALFQSQIFQDMMKAQMDAASSMSGTEMTDSEKAQMDQALGMMGSMFDDINLSVTSTIGLDDKYIHSTTVHMDWDMSSFMTMVEPDASDPAPVFTMDITVDSGDFNTPQDISAPEGATIFPLGAMMPSNDM